MKKNIVLINPAVLREAAPRFFPNGLAYVAAALRDTGFHVSVIDCDGDSLDEKGLAERLRSLPEEPLWIGFGGMITRFREFRSLVPVVKELFPKTPVIVGNSGAATVPELYFKYGATCAVLAEGEEVAVKISQALHHNESLEHIPGLLLRKADQTTISTGPPDIGDIECVKRPAWELFPVKKYLPQTSRDREKLTLDIQISRGCPYNCSFCYRQFGRIVRKRDMGSIINEMKFLQSSYTINFFSFLDDLFTVNKAWITEFCQVITQEMPGIHWRCLARVDTVDQDMLHAMAEAGCCEVHYGVESASRKILTEMNKKITPEQATTAIQYARNAGLEPVCSLIFGMPSETQETIQETIDFCLHNNLRPLFHFATPYPGTTLFDWAVKDGKIPDLEEYVASLGSATEFRINLTSLSDSELVQAKSRAERMIKLHYYKKQGMRRGLKLLLNKVIGRH